ncbi:MAG: hypothetical protein M3377_08680 [Actinomycetota bacterium]|nr:hypothetical protein [Actinomycetota bacterium]
MDAESLARARERVAEGHDRESDPAALASALERARTALETLAERTAELETAVPERLGSAVQEGMRAEVLPAARQLAEVRGLAAQTIRRLESLQGELDAERRARVEDLAVIVELVASGWSGVERRLDRIERLVGRVERSLEDQPVAELYRIEDRQERQPGA